MNLLLTIGICDLIDYFHFSDEKNEKLQSVMMFECTFLRVCNLQLLQLNQLVSNVSNFNVMGP
jgi:hypothetical protein